MLSHRGGRERSQDRKELTLYTPPDPCVRRLVPPGAYVYEARFRVAVVKTAERTALRSAATATFFMKGAPKVLEQAPEVLELFVVLARTGERRDLTRRWEFLLQTCINTHKHFTGLRVDYQPDLARN